MPGEWITTNGFDCVYYLSDATQIDIVEKDDDTWSLLRSNTETGETFEQEIAPNRLTLVNVARKIIREHGLKTVPSAEQRAAPWFKGEDYDYLANGSRPSHRKWIVRAPATPPVGKMAVATPIEASKYTEVNGPPPGIPEVCPICRGDCAGANPPVYDCPYELKRQADRAANNLNAMIAAAQAEKLNALMRGAILTPNHQTWHCDKCRNEFGGPIAVCPECGGVAHA